MTMTSLQLPLSELPEEPVEALTGTIPAEVAGGYFPLMWLLAELH